MFSGLRPVMEKYPFRSIAALFGLFCCCLFFLQKDEFLADGIHVENLLNLLIPSVLIAIAFYLFIRYATRFISWSRDD